MIIFVLSPLLQHKVMNNRMKILAEHLLLGFLKSNKLHREIQEC